MREPKIGDVLRYFALPHEGEGVLPGPRPCVVTQVFNDRLVDVRVDATDGGMVMRFGVPLQHPGDASPGLVGRCEWPESDPGR